MEKTNVMRILEQHGISYIPHTYPHGAEAVDGVQVAKLLGQDPECVYKTLVARGKSGNFLYLTFRLQRNGSQKGCKSRWRKVCCTHSCQRTFAPHRLCTRRLFPDWYEKTVSHSLS